MYKPTISCLPVVKNIGSSFYNFNRTKLNFFNLACKCFNLKLFSIIFHTYDASLFV